MGQGLARFSMASAVGGLRGTPWNELVLTGRVGRRVRAASWLREARWAAGSSEGPAGVPREAVGLESRQGRGGGSQEPHMGLLCLLYTFPRKRKINVGTCAFQGPVSASACEARQSFLTALRSSGDLWRPFLLSLEAAPVFSDKGCCGAPRPTLPAQ